MQGAPNNLVGRIIAPVESSTVECGYLCVSGWALTDPEVSRIEVTVDGRHAGTALWGLPGPAGAPDDQSPQASVCGFEFELDLSRFTGPGRPVRLGATAITSGGGARPLDGTTIMTGQPTDEGKLPDATAPVVQSPGGGALDSRARVAVVVNDLLRAGSQLRLVEVLTNLVEDPNKAFTVFSPLDGPLRADLSQIGVKVKICPAYRYESADGYANSAALLASELRSGEFALVWASTQVSFIGIEAARLAGLPSLFLIQQNQDVAIFWGGALSRGEIDPLVYRRAQELLGETDQVVVVCEASRETYRRHKPRRGIAVIQNSIDLEAVNRYLADVSRTAARRSLGINEGTTLVVCCGVIAPHKGQTVLAQAFARVAAERTDTTLELALVGDIGNRYSAGLKTYLERGDLGAQVHILPLSDDVYRWYRAADVAVSPSQEEAQPSVVLEAMAFGIPVASTSVGGTPEVVEDGVTGLLCRPGDVDDMANLLRRALDLSPQQRTSITDAARARVDGNHDAKKASRRFRKFLDELLRLNSEGPGASYLPKLSKAARAGFGAGQLDTLLGELETAGHSYERVGVDRALAIACDLALRGTARELSILDVGCSVGTISALLSELGHRVTAIDNDAVFAQQNWHKPNAVNAYRQELTGPNWQFVAAGLAEHLDSSDRKYDCALLLSVVHHWLEGSPHLGASGFDPGSLDSLLRQLCSRVEDCIYLETVLADEYDQMPYDPEGTFAFPGWFLDKGLATSAELVASTVANGGRPRRLYRVEMA